MFSSNGVMQGSVLIDGFVRAMWVPANSALVITPFEKPIPKAERLAVVEEALLLADFLNPGEKHAQRASPCPRWYLHHSSSHRRRASLSRPDAAMASARCWSVT